MKNLLWFITLLISVLIITSCQKDHTSTLEYLIENNSERNLRIIVQGNTGEPIDTTDIAPGENLSLQIDTANVSAKRLLKDTDELPFSLIEIDDLSGNEPFCSVGAFECWHSTRGATRDQAILLFQVMEDQFR